MELGGVGLLVECGGGVGGHTRGIVKRSDSTDQTQPDILTRKFEPGIFCSPLLSAIQWRPVTVTSRDPDSGRPRAGPLAGVWHTMSDPNIPPENALYSRSRQEPRSATRSTIADTCCPLNSNRGMTRFFSQ